MGRTDFADEDDIFLYKYLAKYKPTKQGRMGNAVYKALVENDKALWPWAERHSWQSWRERYKTHEAWFDKKIRQYQQKRGMGTSNTSPDQAQSEHANSGAAVEAPNTPLSIIQDDPIAEAESPVSGRNDLRKQRPSMNIGVQTDFELESPQLGPNDRASSTVVGSGSDHPKHLRKSAAMSVKTPVEKPADKIPEGLYNDPGHVDRDVPGDGSLGVSSMDLSSGGDVNQLWDMYTYFHKERYSEFKKHAALLDYHTKVKILRQFSPAVETILDDSLATKKFLDGLTHVFSYLNQHGILKAAEDLGLASPAVVSRSIISRPSKLAPGVLATSTPVMRLSNTAEQADHHPSSQESNKTTQAVKRPEKSKNPQDQSLPPVYGAIDVESPIHPRTEAVTNNHDSDDDSDDFFASAPLSKFHKVPDRPGLRKPAPVTDGDHKGLRTKIAPHRGPLLKKRLRIPRLDDDSDGDTVELNSDDVDAPAVPRTPSSPKERGQQKPPNSSTAEPASKSRNDASNEAVAGPSPEHLAETVAQSAEQDTPNTRDHESTHPIMPTDLVGLDIPRRPWQKSTRDQLPRDDLDTGAFFGPREANSSPVSKGKRKEKPHNNVQNELTRDSLSNARVPRGDHNEDASSESSDSSDNQTASFLRQTKRGWRNLRKHLRTSTADTLGTIKIPVKERRYSEKDRTLVTKAGEEYFIKCFAENHRFPEDVVRRVWENCNDLHEADVTLQEMRLAAERVERRRSRKRQLRESVGEQSEAQQPPEPKRRRVEGLQRSTLSEKDVERLQAADKVYSPLSTSRAGKFMRLAAQGRRQEAIRREMRNSASIAALDAEPVSVQDTDKQPTSQTALPQASSEKHIWTAQDDKIIWNGDEAAQKELQSRMGARAARMKIVELMAVSQSQ